MLTRRNGGCIVLSVIGTPKLPKQMQLHLPVAHEGLQARKLLHNSTSRALLVFLGTLVVLTNNRERTWARGHCLPTANKEHRPIRGQHVQPDTTVWHSTSVSCVDG